MYCIKGFVSNELFQISHDCVAKLYVAGKIFGKIYLKAIRDTFFTNMWSVIRGGKGDWGCYPTEEESSNF